MSSSVVVFDDSSDDDPLVKMKTTYSLTKKTQKKENKSFRSNGKNNRTAGGFKIKSSPIF